MRTSDFIASSQATGLCHQRLLWSRQIEQPRDRTPSEAVIHSAVVDRLQLADGCPLPTTLHWRSNLRNRIS
jgi:hypothetical protein